MKTMQKGGPIKKKLLASDSNNAKYLFDKNGNKTTKEQYFNTLKTLGKKPIKKMELGGTTTKRIIKKSTGGMYGIPQENLGTSGQYGFAQKGGTVKKPLKKTRIIDSKIPMKGPGAPVYKPLLAKKGGAVKKMKTGGATKATKFAALAPPYNKATFADKIVGAKKNTKKK